MGNPLARKIVDSIYEGKASTLKEDFAKAAHAKAADVIEARKINVAKKFFTDMEQA